MVPQSFDDRRPDVNRRVGDLEEKYSTIITRLNTIDATLVGQNVAIADLTALKNQITGVLNFLKFVGFAGLGTMVLFLLRFAVKDFVR